MLFTYADYKLASQYYTMEPLWLKEYYYYYQLKLIQK